MTVYVFDHAKRVRMPLAKDQVTALIHDEGGHSVHAEIDSSAAVVPGEYIGFRCVDDKFRMFVVDTAAHDDDVNVTDIEAVDAAVAELKEIIIEEEQQLDVDLHKAITSLLPSGAGWIVKGMQPDRVEKTRAYYASAWEMLKTFETLYAWRTVVYYEFSGTEIGWRVIETMPDEAIFRGRILNSRKDASKVYVSKKGKPITRLYVLGPAQGSRDVQTNLTIADAEWSMDAGDPADKPKGQTWIEDVEAVAKYGLHTDKVLINGVEDPKELLKKGWEELQRVKEPSFTAEATVTDVEFLPGHSHQQIRMADLIAIRFRDGSFAAAAKVINIKRDYIKPGLTKIIIGDKKDAITSQVGQLITSATHTFERLTVYQNRFREDEALIQLNAEFIQANAKDIELNAEETIRLNSELLLIDAEITTMKELIAEKASIEDLEAQILSVVDNAYVGGILSGTDVACNSLTATSSVWTEYISSYSITTAELILGDSELQKKTMYVVTGIETTKYDGYVTGVKALTTEITYYA